MFTSSVSYASRPTVNYANSAKHHGGSLTVYCISVKSLCSPEMADHTVLIFNEPSRQTQPPMLSRMGNEWLASCIDAVWLDNEGRCGLFH